MITMSEFKTPEQFNRIRKMVGGGTQSPPVFSIPPSPCMKRLGYGTGVYVYLMDRYSPLRGCYRSPWAVKKVNRRVPRSSEYGKRIHAEADVLKGLCHPNIIGFRSYTKEIDGTPCLMMECGEKSLLDIIEERQNEDFGPFAASQILKMAKDIAAALCYLHVEKRLLHGDIKSANILIKGEFEVAKLCDFGVTLKLDENGYACPGQEFVGTECWSPPEVLRGEKISQRSDIFSLGLVMWEMLSLNVPHIDKLYFEESSEEIENPEELESRKLQGELDYSESLGTRPPIPGMLPDDYMPVIEIYYACTEEDESLRPTAHNLLCALKVCELAETAKKEKVIELETLKICEEAKTGKRP
ncbi:lymphokine-activated killer T-cell-originated protein kinase-like isoform X3 [Macrobrachium rosenbergii]|uniref:lymphokine-activated killer T-cell-originated protein kinase-like isoform X1 n=2 Tax=Macrobrachium rosenbergii TaxID=79674 RepID=UPI0034D70285